MYLSKSIYVRVWSCPKGAWINKYHPEAVPQDEGKLNRFRNWIIMSWMISITEQKR